MNKHPAFLAVSILLLGLLAGTLLCSDKAAGSFSGRRSGNRPLLGREDPAARRGKLNATVYRPAARGSRCRSSSP